MPLNAALGFAAIALTLIVCPGPDWAYILAAGVRDHVVLPAVSGLAVGYGLITLVVVVGVGPLVANVPLGLTGLTVAGAAYLTYLGVRTLRGTGRVPHGEPTAALASSPSGYLARGIGVSALNPKGLLLFLSILPQFARQSGGWPLPAQLALLGGIFVLIAAVFYLALGHTADRILGARPSIAQVTTRVAGVAMVLVGIGLLGERVIQVAH